MGDEGEGQEAEPEQEENLLLNLFPVKLESNSSLLLQLLRFPPRGNHYEFHFLVLPRNESAGGGSESERPSRPLGAWRSRSASAFGSEWREQPRSSVSCIVQTRVCKVTCEEKVKELCRGF